MTHKNSKVECNITHHRLSTVPRLAIGPRHSEVWQPSWRGRQVQWTIILYMFIHTTSQLSFELAECVLSYFLLTPPFGTNFKWRNYNYLVLQHLEKYGIPVPNYALVNREYPYQELDYFIEQEDFVEVHGKRFLKPFVEKPVNGNSCIFT